MKIPWRWFTWSIAFLLMLLCLVRWSSYGSLAEAGDERIALHLVMAGLMMALVFTWPALSRGKAIWLMVGAALAMRLVLWFAPVSDDVNRYLWEGSLIWKGENPYATTVDDARWEGLRDDVWEDINHRDRLTAYPPGMELVMGGASWLWYDLKVFKIVALLSDLWILVLLGLLLKEQGKPLRWLGFYAFNPIILLGFAAEAHLDGLMMGSLLTALFYVGKVRWKWAWFWLAIAVQMKFIVIVLLPYFIVRGEWKKSWVFAVTLIVPSLFFGVVGLNGVMGLLGFGSAGAFNGGFYELLRFSGMGDDFARKVTMGSFVAVGLFFGLRCLRGTEADLQKMSFLILGALLICSPVVHFWYLSWIIPFVVLRPSLSWLLLCGMSAMYFLSWQILEIYGVWGYERQWVVVTWLPFFVFGAWEFSKSLRRLRSQEFKPVKTVDLVIPVMNGGEGFADFLKELRTASPEAVRIIVVDGGSSDESCEVAVAHGCELLHCQLGRGEQIAAGMEASSADLVAIIHADTRPLTGWIPRLLEVAHKESFTPAFALGQRFSLESAGLLFVEILNEARATFEGSIFGDQTLIIRKEALIQMGGFPKQPLMEDVEVSWRLMDQGRIGYLGKEWVVSAEKWQGRYKARFRQVIGLMLRYRWVRRKGVEAAAEFSGILYQEYYRKKHRR